MRIPFLLVKRFVLLARNEISRRRGKRDIDHYLEVMGKIERKRPENGAESRRSCVFYCHVQKTNFWLGYLAFVVLTIYISFVRRRRKDTI